MVDLCWVSPFPPSRSGLAEFSSEYLRFFPKSVRIQRISSTRRTLFQPPRVVWAGSVAAEQLIKGARATIYHLGNSLTDHLETLELLQKYPGFIYLHDVSVHEMLANYWIHHKKTPSYYLDTVERLYGRDLARAVARRMVVGNLAPIWKSYPDIVPLCEYLFPYAKGFVVHSNYARSLLKAAGYSGPICALPHPVLTYDCEPALPAPSAKRLVLAAPGFITANKHPENVVQLGDFLSLTLSRPVDIVFGGEPLTGVPSSRLNNRVLITGHLSRKRYIKQLRSADFVVAFRRPTLGEASGVVIQALALGKLTAVSDVGWYSEQNHPLLVKWGNGEYLDVLAKRLVESRKDGDGVQGEAVKTWRELGDPHRLACRLLEFVGLGTNVC